MTTCPRCASPAEDTARFCTHCGASLPSTSDPVDEPGPSPGPDEGETTIVRGDELTDLAMPVADATRAIDVDLVHCPACGASNAVGRTRCGRCRGRLRPDAPPLPDGDDESDPGPTTRSVPLPESAVPRAEQGRRRRGVPAVVILLGLVVGGGVGLLAGLGVGPFAAPDAPTFDPLAYQADPAQLAPSSTGASSTSPMAGDVAIGPEASVDGNAATAWVAARDDAAPRLRHRFDEPVWVSRIDVATGWQVDDDIFFDNGRVTGATIDLGTLRVRATIGDRMGWQVIRLPRPVLLRDVLWQITETAGGDAVIADVRYLGWVADEDDAQLLDEEE